MNAMQRSRPCGRRRTQLVWSSLVLTSLVLVALSGPIAAAPAADAPKGWEGDCPTTLKMHGLLSRARVQCGFRFYSERMLTDAKTCQKRTAKTQVTATLASGVTLFDKVDKAKGHKAACQQMARDFPMVVQP